MSRSTFPTTSAAASRRSPSTREIRPHQGAQARFLSSAADIAIYGGSAGGGKTWALLLEPLRHIHLPQFGGVIFRRTSPQITNEGGLWDESMSLYPHLRARPKETTREWIFPSGCRMRFSHLQHDKDRLSWQGSQIAYIGWDELTHFSESQFWYLTLSRARSLCGIVPYTRATCNPDPFSWVATFLAPWIDPEHEEPAQSGELRWFIRDGNDMAWVPRGTPDALSATFVRASLADNPTLLASDPNYLAKLRALPLIERKRLLEGDWTIVEEGNFFKREWFPIVDREPDPASLVSVVRFWDLAATELKPGKDPDWTEGCLACRDTRGATTFLDYQSCRDNPAAVEALMKRTLESDRARFGPKLKVRMEEEGGSSGKIASDHFRSNLFYGVEFRAVRATGSKEERARPVSSLAEAGKIQLLRAPWNGRFLNQHTAFPTPGIHDDMVDAASGAVASLASLPALPVTAGRDRGRGAS